MSGGDSQLLEDIMSSCSQVMESGDKTQLRHLEQFQQQFNVQSLKDQVLNNSNSAILSSADLGNLAGLIQSGLELLFNLIEGCGCRMQGDGSAAASYTTEFLAVTLRRLTSEGLTILGGCQSSHVQSLPPGAAPRRSGTPVISTLTKSGDLVRNVFDMCGRIVSSSINLQLSLQELAKGCQGGVVGRSASVASKQLGLCAAYAFISRSGEQLNLDELQEAKGQLSPISFTWFVHAVFTALKDPVFCRGLSMTRTFLRHSLTNRDAASVVAMLDQAFNSEEQSQNNSRRDEELSLLHTTQLEALAAL